MSFDYPSYFVKPKIQTNTHNNHVLIPMQMAFQIPVNSVTTYNHFPQINISPNNIGFSIMQKPEYDYVVFIILTKDLNNNFCGLLPITMSNYINLFAIKINIGDDPEYVMNKLINSYGLDPHNIGSYGKYTKLKHVEKHNDLTYKIGVLYVPNISQSKLNTNYQILNNNNHHIEYVDLNKNYKYCTNFTTNNILYALKCTVKSLI